MEHFSHLEANQISALLEGQLPRREARRMRRHMADCSACRVLTASAHTALASLGGEHAARRARPVFTMAALRWQAPLAAAAAVAITAGVWAPRLRQRPAAANAISEPVAAAPRVLTGRTNAANPTRVARRKSAPTFLVPEAPAPPPDTTAEISLPSVVAPPADTIIQPSIDFSPLMTGFQDQPALSSAQAQLAALRTPVSNASAAMLRTAPTSGGNAIPGGATPIPGQAAPVASLPFSAGLFNNPGTDIGGPLAPGIASSLGWAVSRSGKILRFVGSGVWSEVGLVPGIHFHAVASQDSQVWAGGNTNEVFVSQDRGASWRRVVLPDTGDHPSAVEAFAFTDAAHGTIAAGDGHTWTTSDGGLTWARH